MLDDEKHRVCPVERAGHLVNPIRRWFQNPRKILKPHIQEGMTVLDMGCGPGFFTRDIAHMVGERGRVFAADLQEEMLAKLSLKVQGTLLENRITRIQCSESKIGITEPVDFALLFYMVHEVPNSEALFRELYSMLKSRGRALIAEPSFHVSKRAFEKTLRTAQDQGFIRVDTPKVFFSKTALIQKQTD